MKKKITVITLFVMVFALYLQVEAQQPTGFCELAHLKVRVIVTGGVQAMLPAKNAASTIPIITAEDNDPLGPGFVTRPARPGGNITGLSNLTGDYILHFASPASPELAGKHWSF